MVDMTIDGLSDLSAILNRFPTRVANGALRSGLRQAANVVRDQAKANFNGAGGPNDLTGALQASIRTAQRRGTVDRVVFNVVAGALTTAQTKKFGTDSAYYALWVEKGHINRKMHDALRGSKQFVQYQRSISASNTPPHPFMRPALESKAEEAIQVVVAAVRDQLGDAVK
jgi:HK97 gp10 family phage protein